MKASAGRRPLRPAASRRATRRRGALACLGGGVVGLVLLALHGLEAQPAPTCSISTTAVTFGTYDVFAASPLDSTGSVTYNCRNTGAITVTLGKGGAPTFDPRRMLMGSEPLVYNLYRDAARTMIWGDGTGGSGVYSDPAPPNNKNVTVIIYGRIPAGQDVTAGSYSDSVVATVNF